MKFEDYILFKHSIHGAQSLILYMLMFFNKYFANDFSQIHYKVVLSLIYLFLTQNSTFESNFNLNIYIIVWNNEMYSISWIQNYVCKRRRKMVSFIFMTMLNDIHLMLESWEIWDNSIVSRIAKILLLAI